MYFVSDKKRVKLKQKLKPTTIRFAHIHSRSEYVIEFVQIDMLLDDIVFNIYLTHTQTLTHQLYNG